MKCFSKLFLVIALAAVFFSCSSDDGDSLQDPKPEEVVISYFYENTADFLRYANVEVIYLDKNGKEQTVVLNSSNPSFKYEESVRYASAPTNYACKFVVKKSGVQPETETCKAQGYGSYRVSVKALLDDGASVNVGKTNERLASAKENDIKKMLEGIPDAGMVVYEYTHTLNK